MNASAPGGVTRNVAAQALPDLLESPPRAAVTYVRDGVVDLVPVRARTLGEEQFFAVSCRAPGDPADPGDLDGAEVVLTRDDGPYWWQLRAINVRGVAERLGTGPDGRADPGARWYRLTVRSVVAWDYGAMREQDQP